jgi:hypothetical protein
MSQDRQPPRVVFRVRAGRQEFTCRGYLVWEGGIVSAIAETADDDGFVPEKVRLEESDLELKHDAAGEWYQYHGFVIVPPVGF